MPHPILKILDITIYMATKNKRITLSKISILNEILRLNYDRIQQQTSGKFNACRIQEPLVLSC